MYQKLIVAGFLGRDPELRYTPSGQAVTNFSLATHESWTDAAGQKQERTLWWKISIFGKQAEICNEYLQKGRQVIVEGRLTADPATGSPRVWTGADGNVRTSFDVIALNVLFLGGKCAPAENSLVETRPGEIAAEAKDETRGIPI